jgi:methylmalonyl-CoA/ethylmalonyl-CoA epimerase
MKIKRIEHVAVAVNNMATSMKMLEDSFGLKMELEEQLGATRLAMYPVGETYIELLDTQDPDSAIGKWIAEKGQSLFHLCFEVDDIEAALDELRGKGVKLLDEVPRTGHGGAKIAFINPESTGDILIELTELVP